jgi:hypothetical protein
MRWFPVALATVAVVWAATLPVLAGPEDTPSSVKTVATVGDIMKTMTIPFSNAVFEAGAEAPKDAAGWEAVRGQAVALAEAGNLLMIGSRAKDRAAWMKYSRAQVDAAEAVAKAAVAKNADGLSSAADALYETCANCHKDYLGR